MRTIYLIRHCETEHFPKKRCIGITDTDLSENGIRQAQRLKIFIQDKNVSGIFFSPSLRAAKTSEIMSDGEIPVTKLAGLHEIDMGDWDGMYFDEIKMKYPEEYKRRGLDFAAFSPPNGESFAECQKRAAEVFSNLLKNSSGNIAVVSHAGFNRALICSLRGIDLQNLFAVPQPFGCVNLLLFENGVCRVRETGRTVWGSDESGRLEQ